MFCSGCGQSLAPGQAFCSQCGRPVGVPVPPVPGLEFQLDSYAGKVKLLSIFWFIYAGLNLVLGFAGLAIMRAFFSGQFAPWMHGPWAHGPMPPEFLGSALIPLVWAFLILRVGLALLAAWGLLAHTRWGRILAIIVAILSILKFPFGTAMAIWTLIVLLGYRNARLYEQL